ncbi:MAG TPA: hypothetical protein VIY51_15155 [Xanthobacteraceae bacterium]
MPKQMTLLAPAICVSLLAVVLLTLRSEHARAVDACAARPGATAPQGSHWYYRLDRATHGQCWYLGPEGTKVAPPPTHRAQSVLRLPTARPLLPPAGETAYARATPDELMAPKMTRENDAAPTFALRWPGPSLSPPREITFMSNGPPASDSAAMSSSVAMSNSYAAEPTSANESDGMPSIWPILDPADREAAATKSKPPFWLVLAILTGALASMALILSAFSTRSATRHIRRSVSRNRARPGFTKANTAAARAPAPASACPEKHALAKADTGFPKWTCASAKKTERIPIHSIGIAWSGASVSPGRAAK